LIIFHIHKAKKKNKKQISTRKSNSDFYTNLPRFASYNYLRNQRKKHQLNFELNAILHFDLENNFYLLPATCAVVNLGDKGNCQFYGKAVNGLSLNKKAN
jgi:hypothetical protein